MTAGEPPELLASRGHRDAAREVRRLGLLGQPRDLLDRPDGAVDREGQDRRRAEKSEEHEARERPVDARERAQRRADPAEEDEGRAAGPCPAGA